jgi:hypothetical protein
VGTSLRVEAGIGQHQTLDRAAMKQMFVDDLLNILCVNKTVPDGIRIDHNDRSMLTLVKAAEFVGTNLSLETGLLDGILERFLQLFAALAATAWTGGVFVPLIGAEEEMMLKLRHDDFPSCASCCAVHRGF